MRVVHVVTAFPRYAGDPITPWLVELVRRQRAAGIDASVLAPSYRGGPADEGFAIPVRRFRYAPAGLETDRLRRRPAYGALLPGYLAGGTRAAAALGRSGVDVAHVHWPMPHVLMGAAMRRASGGRTALVCSYYSVEINWVRRRLPALVPFLRWSVRTADAVTAISHATAEAVRDLESLPVAVVPYGAALEDDGAGISRPAFAGGDPLRLLFVGRLVERKGVEVLVRALAKLRAEKPATLTVIGEGKWAGRIRAEVSRLDLDEMVRFTGHVSADRLAAEYEAADILVLPAVVDSKGDTEGLGVVILEGLRFERPVVASEVGGVVDIVREGESGWLVPPGDADALAARLLEVAANPERAREVAARGRTMAGETFSWPRILAATRKVYELAMERRGRRP